MARTQSGKAPAKCLCGCGQLAKVRGLSSACYRAAMRTIEKGLATEEQLVQQKLIAAAQRGGRPRKSLWIDKFERKQRAAKSRPMNRQK